MSPILHACDNLVPLYSPFCDKGFFHYDKKLCGNNMVCLLLSGLINLIWNVENILEKAIMWLCPRKG